MNRIEVLDLNKTAHSICDLYISEGMKISFDVVRDLLDKWAVEKYPIFEKFGRKLMIESEEEISTTLGIEKNFAESCQEYSNKHAKKARDNKGQDETDIKKQEQDWIISNLLSAMMYTDSNFVMNVLENKAIKSEQGIENFLREVLRHSPIAPSPENYEKAMKQSKLTRQVYFIVKDTGGLCYVPDWYNEESGKRRVREHKLYIEMLPDAFNIALSELKQNLITEPQTSKFVMSIHPYDFVTMSYNSIGWRSCVHPGGDYAKTAFSVMTDNITFVSYIPTSTFTSNGCEAFINNKKFRALSHFDKDYSAILLNKIYPSDFRSFSKVMEQALTHLNIFGEEVRIADNDSDYSIYHGFASGSMYNDLDRTSSNILRPVSQYSVEPKEADFEIGQDVPCMFCGVCDYYQEEESDWLCKACQYGENYGFCQACEEYHSERDMGTGSDEFHCIECAESANLDYCNCEHCVLRREQEEEQEEEDQNSLEEEENIEATNTESSTPAPFAQLVPSWIDRSYFPPVESHWGERGLEAVVFDSLPFPDINPDNVFVSELAEKIEKEIEQTILDAIKGGN